MSPARRFCHRREVLRLVRHAKDSSASMCEHWPMFRAVLAILGWTLVACGGGDDDGPIEIRDARTDAPGAACGTKGEGTSDGTVDGTNVSPVVAAIALAG